MFNDLGSIARDAAEGNLNSVNFPEFGCVGPITNAASANGFEDSHKNDAKAPTACLLAHDAAMEGLPRKKYELFRLAEYERACLDEAQRRLEGEMLQTGPMHKATKAKLAVWRLFCDVTDLHGQIYVVRDIASRIKPTSSAYTGNSTSNSN
jgi:hypothetical protein